MQATAIAQPNIAFIKYWGNRDSCPDSSGGWLDLNYID